VPLELLSKHFPDAQTASITAKSYEGEVQKEITVSDMPDIDVSGRNVLIVDEIVDRGTTLERVSEIFNAKGVASLKTAVLFVNKERCHFPPDFFARETDDWIVFPWET